jgi:hypothetical protein
LSAERGGTPRFNEVLGEVISQLGIAEDPQSVADYLSLIEVASDVESQARTLLREAVDAARSAGATWSAIGSTLGMSKQAAQKRFATTHSPVCPAIGPDERILGPVTTFDEMAELVLAGEYGWHSVEIGPLFHRVLRSDTKWEHVRISMLTSSRRAAMQAEGWQVIRSAFPYTYLKRSLGTPALVE